MFEHCGRMDNRRTTDGRRTDGRRTPEHGYTISSLCNPDDSDELNSLHSEDDLD